jgi:hypothetical protein
MTPLRCGVIDDMPLRQLGETRRGRKWPRACGRHHVQ